MPFRIYFRQIYWNIPTDPEDVKIIKQYTNSIELRSLGVELEAERQRISSVTSGAAANGAVIAAGALGVLTAHGTALWLATHARIDALVAVTALVSRTILQVNIEQDIPLTNSEFKYHVAAISEQFQSSFNNWLAFRSTFWIFTSNFDLN